MSTAVHFLNGKFVSEEELLISPRDLGFARGYAVADFVVTYDHQPFRLPQHIDRLFRSAELIGLQIPWSKAEIMTWVKEVVNRNSKDTEKMIKIYLSGGISKSMRQTEHPTIVIMVDPYEAPPASYYETGVKVKTVKYKRPFPEAKNTNYVEVIRQFSREENADIAEVIYHDDIQVFEGAGSNIFAVINNRLVTTRSNIVFGITRNTLLEILKLDIPIEVRDFTYDELLSATEIFLTGSSKGVRGVTHINGKKVGDGQVGGLTKECAKQYHEYIYRQRI